MATRPDKLIVIGLDGLCPELLKRFTDSGDCPRLKDLLQRGSFTAVYPCPPVDTATNWATLATGTWTGTHGNNSFAVHRPGEPFGGHAEWFNGLFEESLNEALRGLNQNRDIEWLWQAVHRAGRKCLLVNYPGGWPPTDDWLITVDGSGPCSSPLVRLAPAHLFATREAQVEGVTNPLRTAAPSGWANPPDSERAPLEVALFITGEANLEPTSVGWIVTSRGAGDLARGDPPKIDPSLMYCCLLIATQPGEGENEPPYDTLIVCRGRDAQNPVARLQVGGWSDWITETLKTPRGEIQGRFKLQLQMLSPGGREIVLYRTPLLNPSGWANPPEIADRLLEAWFTELGTGPYSTSPAGKGAVPISDAEQGSEPLASQASGLLWTCRELTREGDWDLLITQIHGPDNMLHAMLNELHPESPQYDPDRVEQAWARLREEMVTLDRFVGEIIDTCATESTAVAVVSDHGSIPTERTVWLGKWLIQAGLATYVTDDGGPETSDRRPQTSGNSSGQAAGSESRSPRSSVLGPQSGRMRLHLPDTQAILGDHPLAQNVWVNLKGREPEGIVDPTAYERIRTEIINALLSARDLETGVCPVAAALRKEDAGFLGQWGDTVGDVVYYLVPGYTNDVRVHSAGLVDPLLTPPDGVGPAAGPLQGVHHAYLPGATFGGYSVQGILLLTGPGTRPGLERPTAIWAPDVTPTLCHLMGIEPPRTAEGTVAGDMAEW